MPFLRNVSIEVAAASFEHEVIRVVALQSVGTDIEVHVALTQIFCYSKLMGLLLVLVCYRARMLFIRRLGALARVFSSFEVAPDFMSTIIGLWIAVSTQIKW